MKRRLRVPAEEPGPITAAVAGPNVGGFAFFVFLSASGSRLFGRDKSAALTGVFS